MAANSVVQLVSEHGPDLCRVRGEGGLVRGFRRDILTENLSERDCALLVCPRCRGILREACISFGGAHFCLSCTKGNEQTHPNTHVRNTISSLKSTCPLSTRGCEWLGTLGECENHLDMCSNVHEICKLGCDIVLPRYELVNHMSEKCLQRVIPCEHCEKNFRVCNMSSHMNDCLKMLQTCELGCGILVCSEDMERHLEEECVEKKVGCPFIKYKCEVGLIKRKELYQHLEEKRTEHTELKLNAMEVIVMKQNEMMERMSQQTEKKLNATEDMLLKLTRKVESLTKESDFNQEEIIVEDNTLLCTLPNATKLQWRIEKIENMMKPRLSSTFSFSHKFQVDGFIFNFQLQYSDGLRINLCPHIGSNYDILHWPFRAEFLTYLICHSNRKSTLEFKSPTININKEDYYFHSIWKDREIALFPRASIKPEFIRDGAIHLEIFVIMK
ncbi:TNF receptor-associated factor 4-like isoform X1 [Oopsacas minuta]|uniref:TNF receptor-associated factor 4-like isoform X1 n=1 Tax=Oopsacas minuta TaxID=111878 RepID=A0AAV7JGP8_9METZ|nr:TNF receptor-associated factor 4-like isoform X1 [Oopsacas minuta]